jgi:hypothetical protein
VGDSDDGVRRELGADEFLDNYVCVVVKTGWVLVVEENKVGVKIGYSPASGLIENDYAPLFGPQHSSSKAK